MSLSSKTKQTKTVSFCLDTTAPQKKTVTNANCNIISQLKASGSFKMPTHKRIDSADDKPYSLDSFIEVYGIELGTKKWDGSKLYDPNKPKVIFVNDLINTSEYKPEWVIPPAKPTRKNTIQKKNKKNMREISMKPVVESVVDSDNEFEDFDDNIFTIREQIQQSFEDWIDEEEHEIELIHIKIMREYSRIFEYLPHLDTLLFADIEFEHDNWFTPVGSSAYDIKYLIGGNWQEIINLYE